MNAFALEMLLLAYWFQLGFVEAIGALEFFSLCDQWSKLLGHIVRLAKCPKQVSVSKGDRNCNGFVIGSEPVKDVNEGADQNLLVQVARGFAAAIGSREQRQVEGLAVRAIDQCCFLVKTGEAALAMGTHFDILHQAGSPSLIRKARNQFAAIKCVNRFWFVAASNQIGKFISSILDLLMHFLRFFLGVSYDDRNGVVLGPEAIMGIREVTNHLMVVKPSRRFWPRPRAGKQGDVKQGTVGAIDQRCARRYSCERFAAVRANRHISSTFVIENRLRGISICFHARPPMFSRGADGVGISVSQNRRSRAFNVLMEALGQKTCPERPDERREISGNTHAAYLEAKPTVFGIAK